MLEPSSATHFIAGSGSWSMSPGPPLVLLKVVFRAMAWSRPLPSHVWSSRAGVSRRAELDVQCGPGLAVLGVEVEGGLPPCLPHPGKGLEQLAYLTIVGVGHGAEGDQDIPVSLKKCLFSFWTRVTSEKYD